MLSWLAAGSPSALHGHSVLVRLNTPAASGGFLEPNGVFHNPDPALETANAFSSPSVSVAIAAAGLWGVTMGLFPLTHNYLTAVALLVLAGVFNIAFQSMSQTLVQLLAPSQIRGRVVGLFTTAMMGLRAGSGFTVGLLGTIIGVRYSLAVSSFAVVAVSFGLLFGALRQARQAVPFA